jgi:alkyl hydroperoxide reductase subunit D
MEADGDEQHLLPVCAPRLEQGICDHAGALGMNVIGNPGVDKADFELWSLAVSAINGCGACIDAHEKVLHEAGVPSASIQTAVRFAAIIQSVAISIEAGAVGLSAAAE